MTNQTNQPRATIRDGALKATIWKNFGENGTFYSVDFSRTYKQGEAYKDSHSFSGSEPLQLARLAHKAYDLIADIRAAEKSDQTQDTGAAQ
jgi:hypothetical protein